jgi:hypothetical protein
VKRLPLILIVLPLAACEPTADNAQQQRAGELFDKAFSTLDTTSTGARDVKRDENAPAMEKVRDERLSQAADHVRSLTTTGRSSQQVAARNLVAESHAASARIALRDASVAWARQSALASQLTSTTSSMAMASRSAAEHGKVKFDAPIAELRAQEAQAVAERDTAAAQVNDLTQRAQALQQEIDEAEAVRRDSSARAADLERKSFDASGQLRHDLALQSAAASRQADQAAAKADLARANLEVTNAQLAVAQSQLKNLEDQLAQTKQSIADLQERDRKLTELASSEKTRTSDLGQTLDEMFKLLVQNQDQLVNKPLDDAAREYEIAIGELAAARAASSGDGVVVAEFNESAMKAEHGHTLHKAAMIHDAYAKMLAQLSQAIATASASQSTLLKEAQDASAARAASTTTAASETLVAAGSSLTNIASTARTAGNKELERAALRQLITVNLALASINKDASFKTRADENQTRLNELNS